MVQETTIDRVVDGFNEDEAALDQALVALETQQPLLYGYLLESEEFEAFTEAEREYLLFLALVVWRSTEEQYGKSPEITEEQLSTAEEKNWEQLGELSETRFRERVSMFFTDYREEDLLAFVEDALLEDDETPVTKEGREALFISLKSVIDVLTSNR